MLAKPTVMSQRLHPEKLLNLQLRRGRNRRKNEGLLHLQTQRGRNYLKDSEDPYRDLKALESKSGKNRNNHNSNKSDLATTTDMEA
tara:strand:+ start:473 stop:730 length:258 start_codon:yes stop_codon:yes gene_type:complete